MTADILKVAAQGSLSYMLFMLRLNLIPRLDIVDLGASLHSESYIELMTY
jgi:hypothetical protein